MNMPVVVEINEKKATHIDFDDIFAYLNKTEERFSVFKYTSEISAINRGEVKESERSLEMREIFKLSEETKKITGGYFDIVDCNNKYNPSGIVKGSAIWNCANILRKKNFNNFYVEVGGDIEVSGLNSENKKWRIGIQNPFSTKRESVKNLHITNMGIATSGTYIRGQHIYNPLNKSMELNDVVSLTVIGPNVFEADRFATAGFAMGLNGINFIEKLEGFEGYQIDKDGIATMTSGFNKYLLE
ncbi:MAG: FAD:protein FMN transferase [bacterium]